MCIETTTVPRGVGSWQVISVNDENEEMATVHENLAEANGVVAIVLEMVGAFGGTEGSIRVVDPQGNIVRVETF